jgi:cyclohexanecarboxylate-CoA ligase
MHASIAPGQPARLDVRDARLCPGAVNRDTSDAVVLAEHDHGWYDTGDLGVSGFAGRPPGSASAP